MSGSGGGNGDWRPVDSGEPTESPQGPGGSTGVAAPSDPCDINEYARLNSPDPSVISTLHVDDVLDVDWRVGPPRQLLATTEAGQTAGSITSPKSAQIIQCIALEGRSYKATVRAIAGGSCEVEIEPR